MSWVKRRTDEWDRHNYWSLDLELGGLDFETDDILSVGMVPIRDRVIGLGEAYYSHIKPTRPPTESSIKVHGLLGNDFSDAPDLESVLSEIDCRIRDAVLIVHHQSVDIPFLRAAYQRVNMVWPPVKVVDTVRLLLKMHRMNGAKNGPTDLARARAALDLPIHDHHNALADAIATAELFLVLAQRTKAKSLRQLL